MVIAPSAALKGLERYAETLVPLGAAVTVTAGATTSTVIADRVILALPFSLLRQVDLSKANFPALKMKAINELSMGTNSKLQLQFDRRHWYSLDNNGGSYSDTGYQASWEVLT